MINYKRIMAAGLAATMVMGSSVVAFAADQEASSNGEGETQYVEVNDIFVFVFPGFHQLFFFSFSIHRFFH